jgi:hypothetical protein
MAENEDRLTQIVKAGGMPRAQLLQTEEKTRKDYSKEWRKFERMWQRSAATLAHVYKGTSFNDYHT